MHQKEAQKKEIEQMAGLNADLNKSNSELQERNNRVETDLVKERDKLKEIIQKLDESEQ